MKNHRIFGQSGSQSTRHSLICWSVPSFRQYVGPAVVRWSVIQASSLAARTSEVLGSRYLDFISLIFENDGVYRSEGGDTGG